MIGTNQTLEIARQLEILWSGRRDLRHECLVSSWWEVYSSFRSSTYRLNMKGSGAQNAALNDVRWERHTMAFRITCEG